MSKVKVMKFHQTVMAIIGLYPYPLTESKYKAPNLISPYVMCPCLGGSIVLSALYAYQGSEVLSFVLDAVIIFIGESQALAVYLNMRQKIDMIGNLNQKLQDIVDQGISHKLIFQPQIKLKVQFYRFKKKIRIRPKGIGFNLSECRTKISTIYQNTGLILDISAALFHHRAAPFHLFRLHWKFRYRNIHFAIACGRTISHRYGARVVLILFDAVDLWHVVYVCIHPGDIVFCVQLHLFASTL